MVNANFQNSILRQMIVRFSLSILLLGGFLSHIYGEDLPSEFGISSKSAVISKSLETATYLGNVKLVHERFLITGEKLIISYREGEATHISIVGNPSSFEGTLTQRKSKVLATATEIIYEGLDQILIFKGNAVVKRNRDTLEATSVSYNIASQEISAGSAEGEDPVRLVIKSL